MAEGKTEALVRVDGEHLAWLDPEGTNGSQPWTLKCRPARVFLH